MYGLVSYLSAPTGSQTHCACEAPSCGPVAPCLESARVPPRKDVMAAPKLKQGPAAQRQRDPEQTRAEILQVAADEFARDGFAGARVDRIAAQMRTTKRMIYYYFGSKEELYLAVLERAYAAIRQAEQNIDVDHLDPVAAVRRLAELTFDHHEANPGFIRLVSIENIHRAEHLRRSPEIAGLNMPAIDLLARILDRGYASGAFTRRVDAIDLHMMISAFCVFRIANQHTFGVIFDRDLIRPDLRDHYREMLGDMVVNYMVSG
jgi:AcrR family transcriptional regulator